jgi:hypothetical protein
MYCVSVNLTSSEWLKIQQAAQKAFPNETLSRAEIVRRYTLIGIDALKGWARRIRSVSRMN